jgi:hypothetical protein
MQSIVLCIGDVLMIQTERQKSMLHEHITLLLNGIYFQFLYFLFPSLSMTSFIYYFILSSFYQVFCTFCHRLGSILSQNYSGTVNHAERTERNKNDQLENVSQDCLK